MTDKRTSGVRSGAVIKTEHGEIKDWLVGRVLGKYELVKPIGFGSFASIYEAVHVHLRVPFAIKVLHPTFINHEEVVKRFFREGQAASQLQHENVVFIADFDVEEDVGPYIVMEYLEGETLQAYLSRKGAIPMEEVGEMARQITQALGLAHDKGIIHRDLKPENIFLVPRGAGRSLVKILDFGIAHLADCGESITGARLLGTPVYMAPEQFRGETHSNSLDIYSFGVLLFEMLTGKPPFKGQNVQQLGIEHLLIPAPPLEDKFPEALRQIQAKLLSKDPRERPASMEEAWAELAPALDPNRAFTHWHQQAIDPLVVAKILGEQAPKPVATPQPVAAQKTVNSAEPDPTATVIESLDEYDFQSSYQSDAEQADTARDKAPVMLDEGEAGAQALSDEFSIEDPGTANDGFATSKHAPPSAVSSTEATQIARAPRRPSASDTADEGAIISQIEAEAEALPPLPPIDAPNTTVTPLPANGNIESLYASAMQPSDTQPGGAPPKKAPFPQLTSSSPGFPFPGTTPPPRGTPPASLGTHPSQQAVQDPFAALSGTSTSKVFGTMGNREKRTLLILWLSVMLVVMGVAFFIVNSIPDKKPEATPRPDVRTPKRPAVRARVRKPKARVSAASNLQIIHLTTTPAGATVMENEIKIGKTPLRIERHIGFVSVFSFKHKGYATYDKEHTVTTFVPKNIHKALKPSKPGKP